jgi:two-component system sensor histidine kinase KdpD
VTPAPGPPERHAARGSRGRTLEAVGWIAALAVVTAALVAVRASLGAAHVVLAYLLVVLGASARSGRRLGLTIAVVAFACFNFFFVPPYHTFAVAAPLDWLVLGAFLVTSVVAAQLLARARAEAEEARRRAAEVDRLSALGAEALNAGSAEQALGAVAEVIRTTLAVDRAEVYLHGGASGEVTLVAASGAAAPASGAERGAWAPGAPDDDRLVAWVAERGRPAAERRDGTLRFGADGDARDGEGGEEGDFDASGARVLVLPLRVRARTVGALRLVHADALPLDPAQRRFLQALSYYAALGAERVRLLAEAEHAGALREADRLKDALLASVSHDLRTPLTTIKALAYAMRSDGDERAATIEEEADRLNRFVADLLDLSRLSAGALVAAPEITAAEDVIGAALQRLAGALGDRVVEVSLDPAEPLLLGRFDFVHSLRILVNLVENAVKYSPADTPVTLAARRRGDALEFVVADRGAGVPPGERERIFDPFYRPPGSQSDSGSAGLGLSIARRLAEAQGGSLVYEPAPGGGSRFVLTVPAVDVTDLGEPVTAPDGGSL